MTISELIIKLEQFKEDYGDIAVYTTHHENGFVAEASYLALINDCDGMETEEGCLIEYSF